MSIVRPAVVAAVDGTAADDVTVEWAVHEALMRALPLRIVHVANPPKLPWPTSVDLAELISARAGAIAAELVDRATEMARSAEPGLEVDAQVRRGLVVEQLVQAASDARVLVLGSGLRFDTSRLALGSVATHVTTHAACPVIVARAPVDGEQTMGPSTGRVVVGIDGSEASVTAVGFAFDEASRRMRGLTAVHAYAPLPEAWMIDSRDAVEYDEAAALVLAETLAGWSERYPDVDVISRPVARRPVQALIEESAGATLLVVGSHGHGQFAGMLLGSVSQAVLRHASVTVAVARQIPAE